ncbi:MAG: hypothetical protein LBD15_01405 [Holosporales bacterium]|jgi:flagellar motility protein MotE (MotC chaperone)|nr:hypothetical protein [Holosporales bacterium]
MTTEKRMSENYLTSCVLGIMRHAPYLILAGLLLSFAGTAEENASQKPIAQVKTSHESAKKQNAFDSIHYSPAVIAALVAEVQESRETKKRGSKETASGEWHTQQLKVLNKRIAVLEKVLATLKEHLKTYDEKQKTDLKKMVQIFEIMRPKRAALILDEIPHEICLMVLTAMKASKAASILSYMNTQKASKTTEIILSSPPDTLSHPLTNPSEVLHKVEHLLTVKQKS